MLQKLFLCGLSLLGLKCCWNREVINVSDKIYVFPHLNLKQKHFYLTSIFIQTLRIT